MMTESKSLVWLLDRSSDHNEPLSLDLFALIILTAVSSQNSFRHHIRLCNRPRLMHET